MPGDIVDLLWLSRYDYKPGWTLSPHSHTYFQLIYILGGDGIFGDGQTELAACRGRAFLIRPHQNHYLRNTSSRPLKTLDMKFRVYDPTLRGCFDGMGDCPCVDSAEVEQYWNRIKEECVGKRPFYLESGRCLLLLLLYHLIRAGDPEAALPRPTSGPPTASEDNGVMETFMEYIQRNYHRALTLDSIAEAISYNKSYLCQMIRKCCDGTPMRLLYELRVDKAKELIRTGDYDLKGVASMTGFSSIHHFCRTFTKTVGMSPGVYRDREHNRICQEICVDESFHNIIYTLQPKEAETPPSPVCGK
ncbi:AraC family transcriptional regulator [Ruminococcaceae bacterium OttesenSCG-928-L11]|nr:AraC family transcriptional regulator [Ruminococcaceae bacterium OttesenSCG-928-L11]